MWRSRHAVSLLQFCDCPSLWPARVWNTSCWLSTLRYRPITFVFAVWDFIVFVHVYFTPDPYRQPISKSSGKKALFEIQPTGVLGARRAIVRSTKVQCRSFQSLLLKCIPITICKLTKCKWHSTKTVTDLNSLTRILKLNKLESNNILQI